MVGVGVVKLIFVKFKLFKLSISVSVRLLRLIIEYDGLAGVVWLLLTLLILPPDIMVKFESSEEFIDNLPIC